MKKFLNTAKFKIKKNSPEILIVLGVAGTVVGTVLACKATIKAKEVLDESRAELDAIKDCLGDETLSDKYTKEDGRKDLTIVCTKTAVKLIRLYGPAVIVGALSIGSILASNDILRKRNASLAAAYVAIDKSFKDYRNKVIDKFGEEIDKELRYNLKTLTTEKEIVDENGEKKNVKETVQIIDGLPIGPYTFFFDKSSPYWEKDGDYNRMVLLSQQQVANDMLRSREYLFLNEVLEMLGIPRTPEEVKMGQLVGWVYDENNPNLDNYVDFGIVETFRKQEIDRLKDASKGDTTGSETYERTVLLDFNVDGNILDLLK